MPNISFSRIGIIENAYLAVAISLLLTSKQTNKCSNGSYFGQPGKSCKLPLNLRFISILLALLCLGQISRYMCGAIYQELEAVPCGSGP